MSILVAYATSHGSTREIAERIANHLTPLLAPIKVDCKPAEAVPTLSTLSSPYQAVIIGSAIHAQGWIGPGRNFLKKNAEYLSGKPKKADGANRDVAPAVWAFSVGMPRTDDEMVKEEELVEKKIKKTLTGDSLRGHKLFRGVFEKTDLPWIARALFGCCMPKDDKAMWGDHRDWNEIEAWANKVGTAMREQGIGRRDTGEIAANN